MSQFHWHERDLADWLKEWLELNMDGAVLIENTTLKVRITESYKDKGECLAHCRKGNFFATYNVDLVVKWHAFQYLDDRIVGSARGRYRVNEFTDKGPGEIVVEGEWQYKRRGPPLVGDAPDDVSEVELFLKKRVAENLGPLEKRLDRLRTDLDHCTSSPSSPPRAISGPVFDVGPEKNAEISTRKFVQDVKAKMRSPDFEKSLVDASTAQVANFRCMSLTDADVPAILDALKKCTLLETLDLSSNDITDAGIQPLICALATGTAPRLTSLHLVRTQLTPLGKRQLQGLNSIRRTLRVES